MKANDAERVEAKAYCACLSVAYTPELDADDVSYSRERWSCNQCNREFLPLQALLDDKAKLVETLREYGQHRELCSLYLKRVEELEARLPCDCGWDQAQAVVKEK